MLRATMPTKPAAIHSIVSMKRSMLARFMSAPQASVITGRIRRQEAPLPPHQKLGPLLRQRVVLGERSLEFGQRRIRIDAGFSDPLTPCLDQRFGRLLP